MSLLVLSVVLVSPRILNYDADIALLAGFVIFVNLLHTRRLLTVLVVLYVPSLFVPFLIRAQTLVGCYETLLLLLAFAGYAEAYAQKPSTPKELSDHVDDISDSLSKLGKAWANQLNTAVYSKSFDSLTSIRVKMQDYISSSRSRPAQIRPQALCSVAH